MMKSLLWLLLIDLARVSIQQCTIEVFEDSIALDILQSTETTESNQNFVINETIYNCLSTSRTIGILGSMSVSILYIRSDTPNRLRDVRYDMLCVGNVWMRAGQMSTAFTSNDTRTDCSSCLSAAVNDHHCAPCNSSCTGLNQCYGPTASECCNYNDNGNCTDDCGMNKEVNSTFHCVCTNFWTGDSCDNCSLLCMNGGAQESDCSACQCIPGFEGTICDFNINECDPIPCQNGGNCADLINDYNCTCVAGYAGKNCSIDINECDPNPCLNEGTCTDGINSYDCMCMAGFNGTDCEINIDDCFDNPCENGGSCMDGIDDHNCTCVAGYTGKNCTFNINECDPNPCLNEGNCTDLINDYNCTCAAGFNDTNCDNNIDDCFPNPCQNGGLCSDGINEYNCLCEDGYTGTNCEVDIDDCIPNPCQNNGNCTDLIDDYNCTCMDGYAGKNCSININDCDPNPCFNGGTCTDGVNMYTCACVVGFTGNSCEIDIDDCSNNPCKNGGMCIDLINGYNCDCKSTYSGPDCTDCVLPNCEECEESNDNEMGRCTKCAGVYILDRGTCNENCEIPNCILCDKVDNKCIHCYSGYRLTSDGKCEEERGVEEGQNSNKPKKDFTMVIISLSVAGLIVIFTIIIAFSALRYECKKSKLRRPNKVARSYHNL